MREYILFDTETTGAEQTDRICQIAFAKLGAKTEWVSEYCRPSVPISYFAMSVHGITPDMVENAPSFNDTAAAKRFCELNTPDNVLIAHNAKFDIDMIEKEGIIWQGSVIDTFRCAKHLLPDEQSHALQYLRYSLGLYTQENGDDIQELKRTYPEMMSAHNALFDIAILKLLLKHLNALVDKNASRLIELTKEPILIKKLRFGKYKDVPLVEVAQKDKGYLEWLLREKTDDTDLAYSIKYYLQ